MTTKGTEPNTNIVELQSVSKSFGNVKAVDNVSLEIRIGEFFSILGPSGCGKTTTLRMIGGFVLPDTGQIIINGKVMHNTPPNARPTNMVFQSLALFPHLSVAGNVAFGLNMRHMAKRDIKPAVEQALQMVRLEGLEHRRIAQLSGGQQQRVALARAIVNRPRVLLLDEPLAALDFKLRVNMQKELKRIQEELGTTFVYVTHDQSEALTLSDRIAVMNEGKLVQMGRPEQIYEAPETPFIATFIGDTNLFSGVITKIVDSNVTVNSHGASFQIESLSNLKIGQPIKISLRYEDLSIHPKGCTIQSPNVFEGSIIRKTYLGSLLRYDVEIAGRYKLVCQHPKGGGQYEVGDVISVSWEPESCRIVSSQPCVNNV